MSKERLIIDRKFRSLIPALTKDELAMLTESLKREGCREPIVTWRGKILDGHHRHEICTAHKIAYATREAEVKDTAEAKVWIIKNQFGRRNLKPFQRCELALKLKPLIADEAKRHQQLSKGRGKKGLPKKINLIDTEKELAKIAGVGKSRINQASFVLEHGNKEELEKAREDKKPISHVYTEIKHRLKKEEVEKWAKKNKKQFKQDSKPVEGEPGTRIKYYTDKWGNECYEKETHPEWCKNLKVTTVCSMGYLRYNPAYKKARNKVADFDLIETMRKINVGFAEAEWNLKKLFKKYPIAVIKAAYEFDGGADNLATAKKHLWPAVMQAKKELIKILSKLEEAIKPDEDVPF